MRKDLILKVLDRHKDRRVDFSSKNQRENLQYLLMGIAIGIGVGYMVTMWIVYI